jgi:hypothetical protein
MIKWIRKYAIFLLMGWALIAGSWLAARMSVTSDESIHTASAYLAITRGDFRFDPEHPFLFKYLTALPILAIQPNLPENDRVLWNTAEPSLYDSWRESRTWSDAWLFSSDNNANQMVFLMRIPGVLVFAGLIFVTWYLIREWFGQRAAIWAAFFTATNPTLLAHAATTNTDVPLVFTLSLALLACWRLYQEPARLIRWLYIGASIAIIVGTKHSGVLFVPIILGWSAYCVLRIKPDRLKRLCASFAVIVLTSWALLWATYAFQSPFRPFTGSNQPQTDLRSTDEKLAKLGIPNTEVLLKNARYILPADYVKGLSMVLVGGSNGRPTFIWGNEYPFGQWFFFPLSTLAKTQLVILGLGVIAVVQAFRKRTPYKEWHPITPALLLFAGIFLAFSLNSKLNLGIRHISPVLWIGGIALGCWFASITYAKPRRKQWVVLLVLIGTLTPLAAQSENLIGFANSIARARGPIFTTLHDSNLDWYQSREKVIRIASECAARRGVATVYMNPDGIGESVRYYQEAIRRSGDIAPDFRWFNPVVYTGADRTTSEVSGEQLITVLGANQLTEGYVNRNNLNAKYAAYYQALPYADALNVDNNSYIFGCGRTMRP